MKKTYCLPTTDIIPHLAMRCVMDSVNGDNVPIEDNNDGEALMQ